MSEENNCENCHQLKENVDNKRTLCLDCYVENDDIPNDWMKLAENCLCKNCHKKKEHVDKLLCNECFEIEINQITEEINELGEINELIEFENYSNYSDDSVVSESLEINYCCWKICCNI